MYEHNATTPRQSFTTIKVAKLIMQETGTYNPMYSRPYQTFVDPTSLDNITRRVEENRGSSINGALLAGITSSILKPSATPESDIYIPNGWNERRIRFILEIHITTNTGSSYVYYFQGYTTHLGVGVNGAVDPTMEFIINSFIRVNRVSQYTPSGIIVRDIINESAHVINGQIQYQQTNTDTYLMRPQDIFTGVQSSYLDNAYSYYKDSSQGGGLADTRISLNNESIRSSRVNNLPANYMAKIIDNYQTGTKLADFGQGQEDILSQCKGLCFEPSILENIFIKAISNIKGQYNATSFTFGELETIDPNSRNVTNYITLGNVRENALHVAGQTSYWNGSDRETLVATILSNAIPAVMMDLMISKIHFRSTNHDYGGIVNTVIIDAKSLTNADLSANFEVFKKRLEREIMYDITYGNQETYMLEIRADLFGESMISLSIGSNPMITYTTPSYCDSLTSPIMTSNKNNFINVVHDFETLFNNVVDINREMTVINSAI